MKLDLRYPFLTAGIPKRNTRVRDLYMSISTEVNVPEVSKNETDIAFMSYQTCRFVDFRDEAAYGGGYRKYQVGLTSGGIDLRTHDGRLYKRIGTPQEILEDSPLAFRLGRAFSHDVLDKGLEYGANISFAKTGSSNPLSAALTRQWDWELERSSVGDGRIVNAWPMALRGVIRDRTREETDFRQVMSEISEINHEASERSLEMIGIQTERLLAIDGEIWMSCRPPCFMVEVENREELSVTISLAHAPDGFDSKLSRRYFALSELEQARAYQLLCARKPAHERGEYQLYEAIPQYDVIDQQYMQYDAAGEELARVGYALASECVRYQARTQKWIESSKQDALAAAVRAVDETNYVTGTFGDVTPHIESLVGTWNDLGRPGTYCEIGPAAARKRFGDIMIKRAWQFLENAPIDLGSEPTFAMGGSPGL